MVLVEVVDLNEAAYPTTRMIDHKNWTAIGMRYAPESMRSFVELFTIAASKSPIVMASWYAPTIEPRIHFGAVSLWYMGTKMSVSSASEMPVKIVRLTQS
jgi:hypothetical protein